MKIFMTGKLPPFFKETIEAMLYYIIILVYFSRNRHFHQTKKRYVEQARKAVHIFF